ncbi:hypothetical protein FDC04_03735 [Clostridium botulinum]|nr:hypothetical protein [Clostridium botulinum]
MSKSKLPIDLKFLFENKYIECMHILIILFLNEKKRKGVKFEEVLYYTTLISLVTGDNHDNYYIDEKYIQNNYLCSEEKIRNNLIILSNQDLIDINVDKMSKKNELYIKLRKSGKKIVETLENKYYTQELKRCEYLIKFRKFSTKNQKGVLSGNEN